MKSKIIEINGKYYLTVGGIIQYECDEEGNRLKGEVCRYEEGFKDGAEFGYNKCFEQIRKIVNEDTRLDCIIPELLRLKEIE